MSGADLLALRRSDAERLANASPTDPANWIALSRACHAQTDDAAAIAAARRAVALAPDNIEAISQLATVLYFSGQGVAESRPWFEKLLALDAKNRTALHYLYYFAITSGQHHRALRYAQSFLEQDPHNPRVAAWIGRAHDLLGNRDECVKAYDKARDLCEDPLAPQGPNPSITLKPAYAHGGFRYRESESISEAMCAPRGIGVSILPGKQFPEDTAARIERLRRLVAGRDIMLFGFGPSLQDIAASRRMFADFDFASMTLSTFSIIEEHILNDLGRRIDIVCQTHPRVVELQANALAERFAAPEPFMLTLPLNSHAMVGQLPGLAAHADRILWFDAIDESPPAPHNPLHFCSINTLLCAVNIAVLACPRRVFLFGFDGKIRGESAHESGALYFAENDARYNAPRRREADVRDQVRAYLWWDTRLFNENAPVSLRHVSLLFDIPLPPIYNVCPDSALEPFPRISIAEFQKLIGV
jgi:tetratricopeptide (TPR) repeat protein